LGEVLVGGGVALEGRGGEWEERQVRTGQELRRNGERQENARKRAEERTGGMREEKVGKEQDNV
jgi:hypothetical protein